MIESAADRALMFDPAAFAEVATLTPSGGAPVEVSGIFTDGHRAAFGDPGASTALSAFTLAAGAAAPRAGDILAARSVTWRIADTQPDGSGLIRLILERA